MKTKSHLVLAGLTAIGWFASPTASAVNCYWNNAGGDSLWSNAANWEDGSKPGSNDVDNVYLANDCPDEPQKIILDESAWIRSIYCTASGNRHYTITPVDGETIRIGHYYGLNGSTARTVDLTINAGILLGSSYLRAYCYGGGLTTLNGPIGPSPTEQSSVYLAPYISTGWLVLGASNNISEIRSGSGTRIIFNHPHAAAPAGYIRSGSQTILVQTNDVTFTRFWADDASLELGVHESLAGQDVAMQIGYAEGSANTITTLPCESNGTFTVNLTGGKTQTARWSLASDTTLRMTNSIQWGRLDQPEAGFVSGTGNVLCEATVELNATNTYTGGTIIRSGQIDLRADDRLPTNGTVTVESEGVLYMLSKTQRVSELHGDGTVRFSWSTGSAPATNFVTSLLSPGVDGPGTLRFTHAGTLLLEETATARFELDALNATNDLVTFAHSAGDLTLAGTLEIVNLDGLETGTYTLFDLSGGLIAGTFDHLVLPPAVDGMIDVVDGDLVLHAIKRNGSLLLLR